MAITLNSGIYEIVNTVNGKRYVGSAVNLRSRWYMHRKALRARKHHSRYLQYSWDKYGDVNFRFRVLCVCRAVDLIFFEQRTIDVIRPEYNISRTAGSTLGIKRTAESVAKTAAAHRGMKRSAETRAKISNARKGKKLKAQRSAEYRAAISLRSKGRRLSEAAIEKMRQTKRGRKLTEEHKAQIGEGLKRAFENGTHRRDRPPEYRAKIAAGLRGRKATAEARANQSAAQRGTKRGSYNLSQAERDRRGQASRIRLTGKKLSPEHRAAISRGRLKGKARKSNAQGIFDFGDAKS